MIEPNWTDLLVIPFTREADAAPTRGGAVMRRLEPSWGERPPPEAQPGATAPHAGGDAT